MLRRLAAEFIGTAILLTAVVGSGIMAERLAGGNVAVALLANTIATGAALFTLIVMFAKTSGAHFNPVVTLVDLIDRGISGWNAFLYMVAQVCGALLGTALANLMFDLPAFFASTKVRTGFSQWFSEFVATFGLIGVIVATTRRYKSIPVIAASVACYITAAYWFTSSTSFANPAVTLARSLSDTFAGIRPVDAPAFIAAQLAGGVTAALVFRWLIPKEEI
ncbi:MAG: MIP/aquaporin family protein [Pyrinomonadaceae bacterium]